MRYNETMTNFVDFRDPLVLTAYHEAGHAVMAHLCGQIVTTVEIVGDEEHTGSVSSLRFLEEPRWGVDEHMPSAAIEARILCLVADIAAENAKASIKYLVSVSNSFLFGPCSAAPVSVVLRYENHHRFGWQRR